MFGNDHRHLLADGATWHPIGRVEQHAAGVKPEDDKPPFPYCTGTLVAPDLVLTAAHCVVGPGTGTVTSKTLWFRPNARRGQTTTSVRATWAWWGTATPEDDRGNDWGLMRLEHPLAGVGVIPVSPDADALAALQPVSLVGYSDDLDGGLSPSIQTICRVRRTDFRSGALLHDCDMNPGASGGPLLVSTPGGLVVVGVNVAELGANGDSYVGAYSDDYANVAVRGSRPLAQIQAALSNPALGRVP